ncbi:MAG TPA: SEC-C metal-binding domain-containing protein, partial [Phycisphaerae bacterium]|nr:SEC-C metal-binding domain-containing protein [Phycisphaerae bacterium]
WSDGLHQAVEAKERIRIKEETQTLATITLQNYFRMYDKLAGMTGTAMTEAGEFDKIYGLETVDIPTNQPLSRVGQADVIYRTEKEKYTAIVEEIKAYHDVGRPVLVGTTSVENSERLSRMLERTYGIAHEVLNAKHHEKEAEIVAVAGHRHVGPDGKEKGNVTIATNMAGRGTDIKLGAGVVYPTCFGAWDLARQAIPSDFGHKCCVGCTEYDPKTNCAHCFKPKVDPSFPKRGRTECRDDPPCGLHVVGTERHEARRIDNQLRGRTGRQGDPGSSRFFLSLEDDLMRIFARDWVSGALQKLGMEEGMALEHKWLTRGIENAQKKVEERNFNIRKHLLEYDEVMDRQRNIFYGRRQNILEADDLRDFVWDLLTEAVEAACDAYLAHTYSLETVAEWAARVLGVQVDAVELEGKDADALPDFLRRQARQTARETVSQTLGEFIPEEFDADDDYDDGPPPKADYRALVRWAEAFLGVKVAEADLKDASADQIADMLCAAADSRIDATDLAPVEEFLREPFRLAALADWANRKFDLGLAPSAFAGKDPDQARALLLERLKHVYAEKERSYPIEFAIEEYLSPQVGHGNQDFDGLAEWASRYYLAQVRVNDIRHRSPLAVRDEVLAIAREFEAADRLRHTVEAGVREHMPAGDLDEETAWQPLAHWAGARLGLEITPRTFVEAIREPAAAAEDAQDDEQPAPPPPDETVTQFLLARARSDRRNRMTELERYLLLQVHDTSWKDHLLVMDHLKSGVGLRGYAQKDPLIEFKREGLDSFERMLDAARDKFTDLFFKARWVRQDALDRIWAGQSSEHAVADSVYEAQRQAALAMSQQSQMAREGEAVKTITREAPKVGRNDPCPCGSGKKYKKCCGRRA